MMRIYFTGDTIWFGADGGYAFFKTRSQKIRKLQSVSLKRLEEKLKKEKSFAKNHYRSYWMDR